MQQLLVVEVVEVHKIPVEVGSTVGVGVDSTAVGAAAAVEVDLHKADPDILALVPNRRAGSGTAAGQVVEHHIEDTVHNPVAAADLEAGTVVAAAAVEVAEADRTATGAHCKDTFLGHQEEAEVLVVPAVEASWVDGTVQAAAVDFLEEEQAADRRMLMSVVEQADLEDAAVGVAVAAAEVAAAVVEEAVR